MQSEMKNTYSILLETLKEIGNFVDLGVDGRTILM